MSHQFAPELGQALMTNTPWQEYDALWMDTGLFIIADAIQAERGDSYTLAGNSGGDEYSNDVFTMRSYCWCWCDGDGPHSPDGCPPNFEHRPTGLRVSWYKHAGRGTSANQDLTRAEWVRVVAGCLNSILGEAL